MKGEKLIHIKFEYSAGVQCKRDLLSTELDMLKINKRIRRYQELRMNELDIKMQIDRKMKAFKLNIGRLQNLMPDLKIPQILEKAHKKILEERKAGHPHKALAVQKKVKVIEKSAPMAVESTPSGLDAELMEIQNRLRALSG